MKRSATVVVEAPPPTPPPTLPPVPPTPVPSGMTPAPPTQPPRTVPPYTPPPARRPAEIDCKAEPHFCTPRHHMETENGPQIRRPDRLPAATGDEVGSIRVEVTVENNTRTNYYFVERKVVLQIYKDGEPYDQLATTGDGFVMTPTGRMTATFERPITKDGKYTWEAKIWYYSR